MDFRVTIRRVRESKSAMPRMSWGTSAECLGGRSGQALAGARAPGSFERPSRAYVPRQIARAVRHHQQYGTTRSTAVHAVQMEERRSSLRSRSTQELRLPKTPGRIPWGESAPGHGKRLAVGPWGDRWRGASLCPARCSAGNADRPEHRALCESAVRGAKSTGRRDGQGSCGGCGRLSGSRPERSRAGPRRCRSDAGGRCGNPAP